MDDVCSGHSGMCVNMDIVIKQTDANTKDIKTLSDAVIKLTTLVENLSTKNEDIPPKDKPVFWDAATKKSALKLGFILCLVLIFTLVGTNVLEHLNISDLIK